MSLQSTDPIADLLTRIRNAAAVNKREVRVPSSKLKKIVAEKLMTSGYLTGVTVEESKPRDTLVITINEAGANATFTELKRVSKPGRRVYTKANDVPRVKNGRGIVLVSTSQGVVTGQEAVKNRLGGEILLQVY